MRFLVDMPVTPDLVAHLTALGHSGVHASQAGLAEAADSVLVKLARSEDSVVITADLDYPRLLALQGAASPGIILFRGGSYSDQEMVELLDRVLAAVSEDDLKRSITVVDRNQIRRHRLPLE